VQLTGSTIRHRLVFAAALATVAVWFGIYLQYGSLQQEQRRIAEVRSDLRDTSALGVLAVALARERGRTQSLLAAVDEAGTRRTEVNELRARVDARTQLMMGLFPPDSLLRTQLAGVRQAVDQQRTGMDASFSTYSAMIADVNVLASRRLASGMLRLGLPFEHVNAMRDAVERLGRCRGLLNGALASRRLPPPLLQTLHDERLLAEDALQRAVVLAPAGLDADAARAGLDGQRWKDWDREWQALQTNPQDYVQRTSTEHWWAIATAAIDALQSQLDQAVETGTSAAEAQISSIQNRVYWTVAAMVVLGLASVGLLLSTVVRVVQGLGRLVGGIESVTEKRDLGGRIPIRNGDEFGQIGTSVNNLVGTIEELMAEREAQAELDGLTRVLNRSGLDRHLAARANPSRRTPEPFGLLLLDIDHFKRVNDEFGHLQGDSVLAGVARVALQSVRPDDVVGRWGGEEFVVILAGGGELDLQKAADKVRVAIASADLGLGRSVTASIGACLWRYGMDVPEAFKRADEALYQAKSEGRNRCVVAG